MRHARGHQTTSRNPSSWRSHIEIWFQLAPVWSTSFTSFSQRTLTVLSRAAAPAGQPAGAIPDRSTNFLPFGSRRGHNGRARQPRLQRGVTLGLWRDRRLTTATPKMICRPGAVSRTTSDS